MKTLYFKVLFLVVCFNFIQAQCSITVVSSSTGGCAPYQVSFNCPASNTGTLTWYVGNSTFYGSTFMNIFSYPGVYTITLTSLTAISTGTCLATATLAINVVTGPENGCSNTVSVGLKEYFKEKDLLIYPNPGTGVFEVQLNNETENTKLILFNALGQNVYEKEINNGMNTINCSSLSKGIYSLSLFGNGKHVITKKLIIE